MSTIIPVVAAGGVLFKEKPNLQVVLIFRRGVWDLPKGKVEGDETIEACAVREVTEETGLSVYPKIVQPLQHTYHEYMRGGERYGKTTHWFAMQTQTEDAVTFEPEKEEGIEKVEWSPLLQAIKQVGYDNLVDVLESFDNQY
jgi:8-oxo-dGTP pyrophosphatase MutT (NUDIX family)